MKSRAFDFNGVDDYKLYESLCDEIKAECSDISMLVNNIGRRDSHGERFQDASDEELLHLLNVNSFPITFMTRFLGPALKARCD